MLRQCVKSLLSRDSTSCQMFTVGRGISIAQRHEGADSYRYQSYRSYRSYRSSVFHVELHKRDRVVVSFLESRSSATRF